MSPWRGSPTRYEILFKLASGGMATVYVGTARGAMGFRQVIAIKEPHPHLLDDKEYRRELLAEARLASMIHHANVVDVRDVEASSRTIRLIMDYIEGASFGELLVLASKEGRRVPPGVVIRVALDACAGLHAAHELLDEKGRKVGLVHRDVSPQNILVGLDGTTRVSDFGVAKATAASITASGTLKGKIAYMAPEYVEGQPIDRRVDVFGLGIVVWEALAGQRLFRAKSEPETVQRVLLYEAPPISSVVPELGPRLDAALATALAKKPEERFATAQAFGAALEASAKGIVASHSEVAALVADVAGALIEARRVQVRARLSQEPGLLSLMGAPPPSLPESEPAPNSAAPETKPETKPERPREANAAAPTLIDTPPLPAPATTQVEVPAALIAGAAAAPAPARTVPSPVVPAIGTQPMRVATPAPPPAPSVEPPAEISISRGPVVTPAGVPSGRSGAVIVAAALLLGVIVFTAGFFALRGAHANNATNTEDTAQSSAPRGQPETPARPEQTPTPRDSAAELAPLSPPSAAARVSHATSRPASRPAVSAAPPPADNPPPNPY